MIMNNKE